MSATNTEQKSIYICMLVATLEKYVCYKMTFIQWMLLVII